MNGVVMTILCFTGSIAALSKIIPGEALFALMLWIGVMMLTQAFQASPARHGPAVAIGLIPAIAAWGLLMVESSLRAAGTNIWKVGQDAFVKSGFHLVGMVTLERGFLFTSIIMTAIVAKLVDREPKQAGGWALAGAVLSWFGIIPRLANHARRRRQFFRLGGGARHSRRLFPHRDFVLRVCTQTLG